MKVSCTHRSVVGASALFMMALGSFSSPSEATSLRGIGSTPEGVQASPSKDGISSKQSIVGQYTNTCANKPASTAPCDKIKKDAVEILTEDLRTLGSSTNRTYLPAILGIFKSHEIELRIAAADAIGMIGPQDQDVESLAPLANDPVPDVRRAVSQAISHGKGSAISLLSQRTTTMRMGLAPETPADAAKYSIPVAPDSTYLFYGSDPASGRLSYTSKNETARFFKAKAKTGPFKLDDFQEKYRYQLRDEQEAKEQIQSDKAKQLEQIKPDPMNAKAFAEFMEQVQSVQLGQFDAMQLDSYQPALFKEPTVYILEERRIGQRSYPARYVVTYLDVVLKRPGYRLNWMTVPDNVVKTVQAASIVEEKEELARNKENDALKKRGEELETLTKKKDESEKQKFKKGQADLEKELGF